MNTVDKNSLNIINENKEKLFSIFPEIKKDNDIDFDKLKQLLGDYKENDNELYNFTWNGKNNAIQISDITSTGTLLPLKDKSINWNNTENVYIEGDNLEVLKILQKSYNRKIKLIYIDPPYNTGNDFVYKDDYKDNLNNYKKMTNQVNKANIESSGRFHTEWLNMMYPRLRLAKNLLSDDGVIFISIDDHELTNLTEICNEIFGEKNRLAILVWKKKYTGGKGTNTFADYHEYILAYAKDINAVGDISMARPESEKDKFTMEDEYVNERGKYYTRPLKSNLDPRPTLVYPIELPNGESVTTQWICSEETYKQLLSEGRIIFKDSSTSKYPVYKKFYENDGDGNIKIPSFIEISNNNEAKEELKKLFNVVQTRDLPFQTPKPVKLLQLFIDNFSSEGDIVLDFFSGSASTADAVMKSNLDTNKKRKYIMIQLPEECDELGKKLDLNTICDLGEERIRRAGRKIQEENGILAQNLDVGFKVFKLDSSNIKLWNGENLDINNANEYFYEHMDPIVEGRTEDDLLYEILLKEGMMLSSPIEEKVINNKKIYSIGMGYMIVCLNEEIDMDLVREIGKLNPETVIFRDSGFVDENAKANALQELKKLGIEEEKVKSI